MNYQHFLCAFIVSTTLSGCALTSGFQAYDLPEEGTYKTELGTSVNVVKLTQDTLPTVQSAQTNDQQDYAPLFQNQVRSYHLSPGDVLSIQLWAYPEISAATSDAKSGYQIDQNGYIQFPLIGRYKASGKTLSTVNKELRGLLAQYLRTPDVIAQVVTYQGQRYSVQGNVKQAGEFYLNDRPVSVYTALGLAGGVTERGDNTSIQLVRNGVSYNLNTLALEKAGLSLHKLLIQPNDTLYINARENQKIYVMGEAQKNQSLPLRDQGMTLGDVLGESQGINPYSASAHRIYVLRRNPTDRSTQLYHLNLANLGDFGLANDFQMRSNDIVYVDSTGLTRWQRVITQLIPFTNLTNNAENIGIR